jgi:predicted dehydrogenase
MVASGTLSPTGSDDTTAMQWTHANGAFAQLWCSASAKAPNSGVIFGSQGWIATEGAAHRPSGLVVQTADTRYRLDDPIAGQGSGYGPEIAEVARCLRAGLTESPLIPHADTIAIMELLDDARRQVGVKYPGE